MANRLKTLVFVLIMVVGTFGGAPLTAAETMNGNKICPMKCCKKAARAKEAAQPHRTNFCRLTSCTESMPSVPSASSTAQINSVFTSVDQDSFFRILYSTRPKESANKNYLSQQIPPGNPFFLRYHSLLI
jgi:hypothetical protein